MFKMFIFYKLAFLAPLIQYKIIDIVIVNCRTYLKIQSALRVWFGDGPWFKEREMSLNNLLVHIKSLN